ncbi:MAG: flagellar export chaperone FliS [Burkholderiaceae bacterium]|nr:flagellar export chaperone FliS [Burkholderiaceae bacterium]MDH3460818.1 flagellar export chaperone FliS [Burkholderiaceae bacterium]
MFAAAPPHKATHARTHAYHQVGVDTSVPMASSHQLVLMLFDGFLDAVARARGSLLAGRIGDKGEAIGRAVRIIEEGLRSCLNLQAGGSLAADLEALYTYVTLRLTQANLHNDAAALEECARLIAPLRSAWAAIGPTVNELAQ